MKRLHLIPFCLAVILSAGLPSAETQSSAANSGCEIPSFSNVVNDPNIFSEQQEEWLGEILDPQIRKHFHTIADPGNNYLQHLGDRLLAQLPPSKLHYSFTIIDFPGNQSFGMPGGHIYISRRVLALIRNEDELAGLLGHEIGHIVTHQNAIDMTRIFQSVLGVRSVGDRNDLVEKWNQILDKAGTREYRQSEKREQQEQLIADRVALYAMARSGYNPTRFADFFDRLVQTKGNKGNFWSDLFGNTSRDSKRLRELVRNATPMAPGCVTPLEQDHDARFTAWQKALVESAFAVTNEDVPGLVRKVPLDPPLRNDLKLVQFSPDGKYLLAQDQGSIFVLSRAPLENLFRIEAPEAGPGQFTPDSRFIVFDDDELRVERWDIAAQHRTEVTQLALPGECAQRLLSPTGEVMACVGEENELQLIEVATNQILLKHKDIYHPTEFDLLLAALLATIGEHYPSFRMHFSPDGRYFALGYSGTSLAYDLKQQQEMKLSKPLKALIEGHFVFRGDGEIDGYEKEGVWSRLARLSFPAGELLDKFELKVHGELAAPFKGDYLLILHAGNSAVGVVDLRKKQVTTGYKLDGFAIYDDVFAAETSGGAIAVVRMADGKTVGQIRLPFSPLESAKVAGIAGNGKWLALSGPNRGAIWDLKSGKRTVFIQNFEGILLDQDNAVAKFPGHDEKPSEVVLFNPAGTSAKKLYDLQADEEEHQRPATVDVATFTYLRSLSSSVLQMGAVLVKITPNPAGKGLQMTVCDIRTNQKLWEQVYAHGFPWLFYSHAAGVLTTLMTYQSVDTRDDPALKARLDAIKGKSSPADAYVARVVDAQTGKLLSTVVVDTKHRAFRVRSVDATRDAVIVRDSDNRTLVYSMSSGEQIGRIFGLARALSRKGDLMLVETGRDQADLFEVPALRPLSHYNFSSPIVRAEFADDGNALFVLTGQQTFYEIKLAPGPQQTARMH
jgi:peptidase M48-like protein